MFDYTICNCKKVSFFDVDDALNKFERFADLEKNFEEVQKNNSLLNRLWRMSRQNS